MAETVNKKSAEDKIKKIRSSYESIAGKKGYNPWMWDAKILAPLEKNLIEGKATEETVKAILALPDAPPAILEVKAEVSAGPELPKPAPPSQRK